MFTSIKNNIHIYPQKINMKNAFNLQLIDCMSEMLRKKDPEMNNFQAASCTLDASTKIYAYRVDCVHIDTLKMAGGLGRTGNEGNQQEEGGQNDDDKANTGHVKKQTRVHLQYKVDLKIIRSSKEFLSSNRGSTRRRSKQTLKR